MKGLEGMPIRLMIVSLLLLMIVGVGLWQMSFFMDFKTDKDFKEDVVGLAQTIKALKSTGDFGAFTTVHMEIPSGFSLEMDIDNEAIVGNLSKESFSANLTEFQVNLTAARLGDENLKRNETVTLEGGNSYSFTIYYGKLQDDEVKEYTLVFE